MAILLQTVKTICKEDRSPYLIFLSQIKLTCMLMHNLCTCYLPIISIYMLAYLKSLNSRVRSLISMPDSLIAAMVLGSSSVAVSANLARDVAVLRIAYKPETKAHHKMQHAFGKSRQILE